MVGLPAVFVLDLTQLIVASSSVGLSGPPPCLTSFHFDQSLRVTASRGAIEEPAEYTQRGRSLGIGDPEAGGSAGLGSLETRQVGLLGSACSC